MDKNTGADTETHRIHSFFFFLEEEEEENKKKQKRKNCYGQLSRTEHSQTQILELKRITTLSKQSPQYKPKGTPEQIFYFQKPT